MKVMALAGALLALGCGSAGAANLPPNAAFFAECLKSALQSMAVDRDGPYLRFACYGETAEWFYNALGRRDADAQSEKTYGKDLFRFTEAPEAIAGSTYCRRSPRSPQEYACSISLRAGTFLDR